MHGVVNLLKPPGMTSHDAVAFLRRVTGIKRIGHLGTLDPAAAGVLPVCIGQATKLVEYLQTGRKEYIAEATFGYETDTLDAMGRRMRELPAGHIDLWSLQQVLPRFIGAIAQIPPIYSAIKQEGKKLYQLARAGAVENVELKSRQVTIHSMEIDYFVPGNTPRALLRIECSGGTYVRSLVRDIGQALGCGATMTFLVRTSSGHFTIAAGVTVEQAAEYIEQHVIPIRQALEWCATATLVDNTAAQRLALGQFVSLGTTVQPERILVLNTAETIAALAVPRNADPNLYKAEKVFDLAA